jgi:hypothetical protein
MPDTLSLTPAQSAYLDIARERVSEGLDLPLSVAMVVVGMLDSLLGLA